MTLSFFLIFAYREQSSKTFHNQFLKNLFKDDIFIFRAGQRNDPGSNILHIICSLTFTLTWRSSAKRKNPCKSLKVIFLHIIALIETKQIFTGERKPFDINVRCNDDDYLNWFCSVTTDVTLYYPCSFTDDDRKYSLLYRYFFDSNWRSRFI